MKPRETLGGEDSAGDKAVHQPVAVRGDEHSIEAAGHGHALPLIEGAVRGGAMNVMSSFNRIGVVWAGAHHGLMTGILRDEWGMEGAAITDMSMNASWMDYRLGVLAGQDYWCGQKGSMGTLDGSEDDPAIATAVRNAVKHIVYGVTRTNVMNVGDATVVSITPWWQVTLYASTGVLAILTVLCALMAVRTGKKEKSAALDVSSKEEQK